MKQGTELVYPTTAPVNSVRLLVCGGRDYADRERMFSVLTELKPGMVIHGAARGADSLAAEWARSACAASTAFPADWVANGRAAGPIRNEVMLREGKPTLVVAFPGGRGTEDMVRRALLLGVTVLRIRNRNGERG